MVVQKRVSMLCGANLQTGYYWITDRFTSQLTLAIEVPFTGSAFREIKWFGVILVSKQTLQRTAVNREVWHRSKTTHASQGT